jgi:hypothetical protein
MPQATLYVFRKASGEVPLKEWLDELEELEPKACAKYLARIQQLEQSGFELRRPAADILRDHIWELRAKNGNVHYRVLYSWIGRNVACFSHGLTKEGAVPDTDIERAIKARELVESDRDRYTAEWEL